MISSNIEPNSQVEAVPSTCLPYANPRHLLLRIWSTFKQSPCTNTHTMCRQTLKNTEGVEWTQLTHCAGGSSPRCPPRAALLLRSSHLPSRVAGSATVRSICWRKGGRPILRPSVHSPRSTGTSWELSLPRKACWTCGVWHRHSHSSVSRGPWRVIEGETSLLRDMFE